MSCFSELQNAAASPGQAAFFAVLCIGESQEDVDAARDFCGAFAGLVRSVAHRAAAPGLNGVLAIGAQAWGRLFPDAPRPQHLHVLPQYRGEKHFAPSTPGDLLLHVRAATADQCFEVMRLSMEALGSAVRVEDEVQGFRYFDTRAMIGFVDGTENPQGDEAAEAAFVGAEDPQYEGGSYVVVQKYLHDMAAWDALPAQEQEKAIGRRKLDNVELSDEDKPANAHNAVTNISDDDGEELKIVRANMPFTNLARGEYGTYFIGYARDPAITERMLGNMFIGEPPGNYDRLLDFSTAVTGTLFFMPAPQTLEALAGE